MRKITFLMGLLLSFLGAAQISAQNFTCSTSPISAKAELTSGRYLISVFSNGKEGLLYWPSSGSDGLRFLVSGTQASSKTGTTMTASGTNAQYMWDIVVKENGSFTIQSVSSSQYTSKIGAQAEGRHNAKSVSAGDVNIGEYQLQTLVDFSGIPHFTVKMTNGTFNGDGSTPTFFHCNGSNLGTSANDNTLHLSYWEGEAPNTNSVSCARMAFYRLRGDTELASFTYDYQINGVSMKTEEKTGYIGTAFPDLTLPAFCAATKPEGNISEEDNGATKVINVTWSGPFNYTSSVEGAKWYLMTLAKAPNGNLPVVRYNSSNNYITLEQEDNTFTHAKNDQWAFVGNPFAGFKIYNRAIENGRLISSTTMSGTQGQTTCPYVSEDELQSGFTETWDIYTQTVGNTQSAIQGGFAIGQHGTPANKLNRRSQNSNGTDYRMAYWTAGADNGSTFTVSQTSLPDITLHTVDGTSYASFYVDYPVKVESADVKVYTGTIHGGRLDMTVANDKIIPANVGVVLISETAATTAELSISNAAGALTAGDLTGTITGQDITDSQNYYLVLGRATDDEHAVGFYRPTGNSIPGNRAFIYLAGGSVQGLAFNFDGETTGLNNISASTNKQEIYDLSGRRVMKANKGLYIINGKKCFIK